MKLCDEKTPYEDPIRIYACLYIRILIGITIGLVLIGAGLMMTLNKHHHKQAAPATTAKK